LNFIAKAKKVRLMEKQTLLKQEQEAFLKYRDYVVEGRDFLASYWFKKFKKITNMKRLAAALTKRQLKANGITRLNTIKI
jgi:hypothetical protein